MPIQTIQLTRNAAISCACRLPPLSPGQVNDLLQEWIADHPYHTRKQHIFAYDLFKWLERRSSGGCA